MSVGSIVRSALYCGVGGMLCLVIVGCGAEQSPKQIDDVRKESPTNRSETFRTSSAIETQAATPTRRKPAFGSNVTFPPDIGNSKSKVGNGPVTPAAVAAKLKPLQVIVGRWQGIPSKLTIENERPAWRWDYSNSKQPALAFDTKDGGYVKSGRLTWLPDQNRYRLIAELKDGTLKTYTAGSDAHIRDVPADDGKTLDRTFTLTFTQVEPKPTSREDIYRIGIQQMTNDRYLLIVSRKRGSRVAEVNRIGNQRSGTSFAAKLDDYGEKTCVISQGLGTMTVSYKGRTYYVCCSGCKKEFEADPETWIARFEEWKRKKGKR